MVEKKKDIVDEVKEETQKTMAERHAEEVEKGKKELEVRTQPRLPEFINATRFQFVDITSELFREYIYPNGAKIRIEFPLKLSVAQNNAHRVFDINGLSYYIPPGWISIVWKARPGAPSFIM